LLFNGAAFADPALDGVGGGNLAERFLRVDGPSFKATSGWSRKASEAELKGVEVCRDGLKPRGARRETNAGRESPQGMKFTT
jgi:hypothetical protein